MFNKFLTRVLFGHFATIDKGHCAKMIYKTMEGKRIEIKSDEGVIFHLLRRIDELEESINKKQTRSKK